MNSITQTLESQISALMNSLYNMNSEVNDIVHYYFNTPASTLIGNQAANAPSTVSTALTKAQFVNGITMCQQLQNFFGNQAVIQDDYQTYADGLINGSSPANAPLSQDVENIGIRLKTIGQNLIQLNKDAANIIKAYNSSNLSSIIGNIPPPSVIFGCSTTQAKFISGIVAIEQLQNFLNNQPVITSDYLSTIVNWVLGA